MTTTEDIQKAVAEIEERYDGKFIDSQAFADVKALLFAAKALLSSAATDREIIQRQAKMIEELTAERDRYLKALESVLHRLETNRIWDGLKWEYLNIPPLTYVPALKIIREALGRE